MRREGFDGRGDALSASTERTSIEKHGVFNAVPPNAAMNEAAKCNVLPAASTSKKSASTKPRPRHNQES